MTIYAAKPDSPTAHALALLASWAEQLSPVDAQTERPGQQSPRPAPLEGINP
jgi:hypothetical protein